MANHVARTGSDDTIEVHGIRTKWAKQVGKPHPQGIRLNVGVRFIPNKGGKIDYQVRGVVDVPAPPYGDDERSYLAQVLLASANLPQRRYEYALFDWEAGSGGDGVRIDKCNPIPALTNESIFDLKMFTPPEVEEIDDNDRLGLEQHNEWVREYRANRYCRHETRQELHQRYQDIWGNVQVLTKSGKMGLSTDESWYRLQQHVITEMLIRGEPPTRSNQDPRVQEARPFFDGELCRKAASIVLAQGTDHDVIVKYGKREHIEALFRRGEVYLNSATSFNESVHNQAVWDDELAINFKGGYTRETHPMHFYDRDQPPPEHVVERGSRFRPIYELPELGVDQYATATIRMNTDYWMFCMADILDQRLFADFEADSCLIIRRKPFVERVLRTAMLKLPNVRGSFGHIRYIDSLGAWPTGTYVARSIPVHMTKIFRYAYQREVRFVFLPGRFQKGLKPRLLRIGPISDIAEFVPLPSSASRGRPSTV